MPGCMHDAAMRAPDGSGIARLRNGATTRSGRHSATASAVTRSLTSNSIDTSWPARGELDVEPLRQAVERVREEQDAHQQIRGSCSPVSQSTMRRPPKRVSICTK